MARSLRPIVLHLDLQSETYAIRTPSDVGDVPRSPARDDVQWDITGTFAGETDADVHSARVTLPLDAEGQVITDDAFDVPTNGPRVADGPPLRPGGVRSWLYLELLQDVPADTSTAYRLNDGTSDYYWTGSAWALATASTHWSTRTDTQDNVGSFPATGRELVIRCRLSSTTTDRRPSWFGAVVAFGVRQLGDEDDALIRTLLPQVKALRSVGIARMTTASGNGAGPFELGAEHSYDVTDVLAVFNLTDDPDELVELPGTFVAGSIGTPGTPATWTPDTALADGKVVLIEFEYAPLAVVTRHRDGVELARAPAILLTTGQGAPTVVRGNGDDLVRDLEANPPMAQGLGAPDWIQLPLQVSVITELGADLRRLESDVRALLRSTGYRALVSPETARLVNVREVTPFQSTTAQLAVGVQEARASWLIGFCQASAPALEPLTLTRQGGILIATTGG